MARIIVLTLISVFIFGGCAALMREERERALDEAYRKDEITKVEYRSIKHKLRQEETVSGVPIR